jgi:hypothetical protein
MPEEAPITSSGPILNFNSPKAPPTILTLGALLWRGIAWWADVDFILSIREEKIAVTLQLLLDWGWLVLVIVGIVWALGANKTPKDTTSVHWGMVTAVGILAFMTGTLITIRAVGSTPMVLTGWGGDSNAKNCSAIIDTSRLVGLKDKDRIILLCGTVDALRDPIEDDRIAVSQPFTITGQSAGIVAPFGAMEAAVRELTKLASSQIPAMPNPGFMLWHAVAVIPKDVNVAEIKRVSDVAKRGGKIVTEPQAGAFSNPMPILSSPISSLPSAKPKS